MWGLSHIIIAIFPSWVLSYSVEDILFSGFLGTIILLALLLLHVPNNPIAYYASRIIFFLLGILMVYGGIVSWTGLIIWNVPFQNKELFQISMAFADLLSAVFMFTLALEKHEKHE